MENQNPTGLALGVSVNIQRSDGRIHSAIVSGITPGRCVSVEWFERGETKGKEIEWSQIFSLNQWLEEKKEPAKTSKPAKVRPSSGIPRPRRGPSPNNPSPQPTPTPVVKSKIPQVNPTPAGRVQQLRGPAAQSRHSLASPGQMQNGELKKVKDAAAGKRRSHCVKEVERLRKNREERRAKQAEQLQQRLEEYEPGNPNWEFHKMIKEYVSGLDIRTLTMTDMVVEQRISVCVRKRPLNKKELGRKEVDVVTVSDKDRLVVHEPKLKVDLTKYLENHQFRFDYSFDERSTNALVYRFTAQPLVCTIFERGMATCFAYGQTGSGKTHTMGGHFTSNKEQDASDGIYAMAAADVFRLMEEPKNKAKDLTVSASFFEIYGGKVFDLLNDKAKLRVLEDGKQQVQVVGLSEEQVDDVQGVLRCIRCGNLLRTSGTTSANQNSSRSHAVFQILLRKRTTRKLHGKFSLIDLAGNERGADTSSADRQTRMEGAEINKSLLALKECIRALGRKGAHLPFRASKLTQVLRDSFVGDRSRTCMVAMVSPGQGSCEHTLNTLRYADRVKELEASGASAVPSVGGQQVQLPPVFPNGSAAGASNLEQDDLRLLHETLDEGSASADVLNFHEVVSHVVEAQEQLIEDHRSFLQANKELWAGAEQLLKQADSPDCNVEDYARLLDELLQRQEEESAALRAKVRTFRKLLNDEEAASQHVRRLPFV